MKFISTVKHAVVRIARIEIVELLYTCDCRVRRGQNTERALTA